MNSSKVRVFANLAKEKLKKNSPKILVGVGIVSGIAAVGYAIKVSMEVEPIIEEHKECIETVKADLIEGTVEGGYEYTEKDYKKDVAHIYIDTACSFAKLYAPAVIFEGVSIASICAGFGILDKRYATAAAAFASTYTEFSEYRARVAQKYGENAEYEIYHNVVDETIETEDESGKKKKEKVKAAQKTTPGEFEFFLGKDYCKFWDERNTDEQNMAELKIRLAQAISNSNRDVKMNGYMYLDKFAERLGVMQRDAYRQVAIKYNPDFGDDQFSVATNVKIRDAHVLTGGEKVISIEVKGLEPFNVDNWDPIRDFLSIKVKN